MPWTKDVPTAFVRFIGVAELLAAIKNMVRCEPDRIVHFQHHPFGSAASSVRVILTKKDDSPRIEKECCNGK